MDGIVGSKMKKMMNKVKKIGQLALGVLLFVIFVLAMVALLLLVVGVGFFGFMFLGTLLNLGSHVLFIGSVILTTIVTTAVGYWITKDIPPAREIVNYYR